MIDLNKSTLYSVLPGNIGFGDFRVLSAILSRKYVFNHLRFANLWSQFK